MLTSHLSAGDISPKNDPPFNKKFNYLHVKHLTAKILVIKAMTKPK